jgi:hypothetical protein
MFRKCFKMLFFPVDPHSTALATRSWMIEFRSSYGHTDILRSRKDVPWIPPHLPRAVVLSPLAFCLYTIRRIVVFRRIFVAMSTWQSPIATRALVLLTYAQWGCSRVGEGSKSLLPSSLAFDVFPLSHCSPYCCIPLPQPGALASLTFSTQQFG